MYKLVREGIKDRSKEDIENSPMYKSFLEADKLIRREFKNLVISGKFNEIERTPFWILDIKGEFAGQDFGEMYIAAPDILMNIYEVVIEGGQIIYNTNSLEDAINKIKEIVNLNESIFKPKSSEQIKKIPQYEMIMNLDKKIRNAFPGKVSNFTFNNNDPSWDLDLWGSIWGSIRGWTKGKISIQFYLEPGTFHGYFDVFLDDADFDISEDIDVDTSEDIDDVIIFIKKILI